MLLPINVLMICCLRPIIRLKAILDSLLSSNHSATRDLPYLLSNECVVCWACSGKHDGCLFLGCGLLSRRQRRG